MVYDNNSHTEARESFYTAPTSFGASKRGRSFFTAPSYLTKDSKGEYHTVRRGQTTVDTQYRAELRSIGLIAGDAAQELNWSGRGMHVEFAKDEEIPLRNITPIAETWKARVEAVTCGRIRVCRKTQRVHKRFTAAEALEEVRHLQVLQHSHIIKLIGSYYQDKSLSILTYPVADSDLSQFMKDLAQTANEFSTTEASLRLLMGNFFSCLSSATAFVHLSRIKHMDIKPANILISVGPSRPPTFHLFLTDFGISRAIQDQDESQTDGRTGRTEMYCSPEVSAEEPRGRASDIFSLGCVFTEILSCICGRTVQEFRDFRTDEGKSFHRNLSLVLQWIEELPLEPLEGRSEWESTMMKMLEKDPSARPTAFELIEIFPERGCCKKGPAPLEPSLPRLPDHGGMLIPPLPPVPALIAS
ncbi:kinase-like protein [Amniculicola lignicola CBS 123094]|uniref:Kinase-like protein n=1 Tax=Amniculicola lignicola CBS 123094 TaxID=1392246 RepID=A0A6A5W9K2_9PLEO|nr:kinase-like protein [Amniculicola lignicola CBS 123094]